MAPLDLLASKDTFDVWLANGISSAVSYSQRDVRVYVSTGGGMLIGGQAWSFSGAIEDHNANKVRHAHAWGSAGGLFVSVRCLSCMGG